MGVACSHKNSGKQKVGQPLHFIAPPTFRKNKFIIIIQHPCQTAFIYRGNKISSSHYIGTVKRERGRRIASKQRFSRDYLMRFLKRSVSDQKLKLISIGPGVLDILFTV